GSISEAERRGVLQPDDVGSKKVGRLAPPSATYPRRTMGTSMVPGSQRTQVDWTDQKGEFVQCRKQPVAPRARYGQPEPAAGAATVSTSPARVPSPRLAGPRHSLTTRNRVRRSGPPSAQAKQPRLSVTVSNTSPPSRTRT